MDSAKYKWKEEKELLWDALKEKFLQGEAIGYDTNSLVPSAMKWN